MDTDQPAGLRTFRYRPVLFFVATFVLTWVPWVVGAYRSRNAAEAGAISAFGYLGLLGPLVVTLFCIFGSGSRALKVDFGSRFHPRRLRGRYVAFAIAMPPLAMALSIGISLALGESTDQFRPSLGSSLLVIGVILAPIIEEISWRGYGVDSLRANMGALTSTLVFAVLWALWHVPLVWLPGTYQHELASMGEPLFLANFFVSTIPAAIIANWLYYANDRSILIGVVFHAAANASAEVLHAGQVAKCVATLVWILVAVALGTRRSAVGTG